VVLPDDSGPKISGRDDRNFHDRAVTELHNRSLAELPLDLGYSGLHSSCLIGNVAHLFLLNGETGVPRHVPIPLMWLVVGISVLRKPSDGRIAGAPDPK
jgi:hypothetical protein